MEFEIWYVVLGIVILLDIAVSIFLLQRDDLEPFQKGAQIFIVWLIPLFAATGLWLFHRSQNAPLKSSKPFGGESANNSSIGSGD
jgi:hypothetical protein